MRLGGKPAAWAAVGFGAGIAIGMVAWSRYQDRHAQSLFSSRPRRRFAALGWLGLNAPTVDTVALLREYVAWERHPLLRRRGEDLLARLAESTISP